MDRPQNSVPGPSPEFRVEGNGAGFGPEPFSKGAPSSLTNPRRVIASPTKNIPSAFVQKPLLCSAPSREMRLPFPRLPVTPRIPLNSF